MDDDDILNDYCFQSVSAIAEKEQVDDIAEKEPADDNSMFKKPNLVTTVKLFHPSFLISPQGLFSFLYRTRIGALPKRLKRNCLLNLHHRLRKQRR